MEYTGDNINTELKELSRKAESESPVDYIFSLVRITGITTGIDPILQLKTNMESDKESTTEHNIISKYNIILSALEPLELLSNLTKCSIKKPFEVSPFQHLYTGHFHIGTKHMIRFGSDKVTNVYVFHFASPY